MGKFIRTRSSITRRRGARPSRRSRRCGKHRPWRQILAHEDRRRRSFGLGRHRARCRLGRCGWHWDRWRTRPCWRATSNRAVPWFTENGLSISASHERDGAARSAFLRKTVVGQFGIARSRALRGSNAIQLDRHDALRAPRDDKNKLTTTGKTLGFPNAGAGLL